MHISVARGIEAEGKLSLAADAGIVSIGASLIGDQASLIRSEATLLKVSRPIRLYMKMRHAQWLRDRRAFGNAANAAIARLVLAGWLEDRLYDLSSLTASLDDLSRQQVTRRVDELSVRGWVTAKRQRNRVVVIPTERLVDAATVEMMARLTDGVVTG